MCAFRPASWQYPGAALCWRGGTHIYLRAPSLPAACTACSPAALQPHGKLFTAVHASRTPSTCPCRLGGIELDPECSQRNDEGVCTACQQEGWVVDAQTQRCRPKKCTELDSLCQACNEQNLCSACWLPRYYAVDPQTHKVRRGPGLGPGLCCAVLEQTGREMQLICVHLAGSTQSPFRDACSRAAMQSGGALWRASAPAPLRCRTSRVLRHSPPLLCCRFPPAAVPNEAARHAGLAVTDSHPRSLALACTCRAAAAQAALGSANPPQLPADV